MVCSSMHDQGHHHSPASAQGRLRPSAWCGSREPPLFLFPKHPMKQWIAKLFGQPGDVEMPVKTFYRGKLRLQVYAQARACGHTGHLVELERCYDDREEWLPAVLTFDTELQDAIILLQWAHEFVELSKGW